MKNIEIEKITAKVSKYILNDGTTISIVPRISSIKIDGNEEYHLEAGITFWVKTKTRRNRHL